MSRQARRISQTGYYHVIMRGNNKNHIFEEKDSKAYFLKSLRKVEDEGLLAVAGWCIMSNHVHLVIKSEPDDLASAFKSLNIKFAMYYNRKYQMVGHVFQDRFKSEVVETDEYLVNVIRYVHNNPVKAKIVDNPEMYEWSSYKDYSFGRISEGMNFSWTLFSQSPKTFSIFHQIEDPNEYLEIKEDLEKYRKQKVQEIIDDICETKDIEDDDIYNNDDALSEIVASLKSDSSLSRRQMAKLLGVTESKLRRLAMK